MWFDRMPTSTRTRLKILRLYKRVFILTLKYEKVP